MSNGIGSTAPASVFGNTVKDWAKAFRAAAAMIAAQNRVLRSMSHAGTEEEGDVCWCAGGALGRVISPERLGLWGAYRTAYGIAPADVKKAVTSVTGGIKVGVEWEWEDDGGVAHWNDTIVQTKDEIVAGLTKMADMIAPKRSGKTFTKDYQPSKGHVYARRLLKLADLVELRETEKRFSFQAWVGGEVDGKATPTYQGKPRITCGTSACALGWATTMPELRRIGIRMLKTDNWRWTPGVLGSTSSPERSFSEASELAFGLTEREADYMFTWPDADGEPVPNGLTRLTRNATAVQVVANIRTFVHNKYPKAYAKYMASKEVST